MQFLKDRVKIIATLGPASEDVEVLTQMIASGLDIVRLNFSHGSHDWHRENINKVRLIANELGVTIAIMADLQGPKLRLTDFEAGPCLFEVGAEVMLTFDANAKSSKKTLYVNCAPDVFQNIKQDSIILFDDGKVAMQVISLQDNVYNCVVKSAGQLSSRKGVNVLGGGLKLDAITTKDKLDLEFALALNVDFIALSFVKDADDIAYLRELIGDSSAKVLAKLETSEAIENYLAITEAADGIMVARGDLAVEVGAQRVPWLQKQLLSAASFYQKPAIVATQMMESMIKASVPTRAEVSDVANAIIDGADAVMLSAETAVGVAPASVIASVANVCAEANMHERLIPDQSNFIFTDNVAQVIAWSAVESAHKLRADYLVALTETGSTALMFSKFGIDAPILGLSRNALALAHMAMYRHVTPIFFDVLRCGPDVYQDVVNFLRSEGFVRPGDTLVITKGGSLGVVGETNSLVVLEA